jgi:hypothetical protein
MNGARHPRPCARPGTAEIEAEYARLVGADEFEAAAQTLDEPVRGLH